MLIRLNSIHEMPALIAAATPRGMGTWGDTRFTAEREGPAVWEIVFDEPDRLQSRLPRARRILIQTEPPGIKTYWPRFTDQFGIVITPFPDAPVAGERVLSNPCLPSFYGVRFDVPGMRFDLGHDDLLSLPRMPKPKVLSAVLSRKATTPLHRRRLEFAHLLKARLRDRFEVYGRGFQHVADKREAIDPFRYHLAIENTVAGHYWTEKLADPLLGWSLPIYCGAPAAADYFPEGSFEPIDLDDLGAAVDWVERILDEDPYESRIPAIAEARRRVLQDHSLPAVIARIVTARAGPVELLPEPVEIRPSRHFRPFLSRFKSPIPKWRQSLAKRFG